MHDYHHNLTLGKKGEELAAKYLESLGYFILDRNWNLHKGCELDIVAVKDDVLHFVEVKTRSYENDFTGPPEKALNRRKFRNICRATLHYLNYYRRNNKFQIDAIGIVYKSDTNYKIRMLPDLPFY